MLICCNIAMHVTGWKEKQGSVNKHTRHIFRVLIGLFNNTWRSKKYIKSRYGSVHMLHNYDTLKVLWQLYINKRLYFSVIYGISTESSHPNWVLFFTYNYVTSYHDPHYILTNHPIKYVVAMVLVNFSIFVFQVINVVVDWLISSDTRAVHKILSINADLSFRLRLCNAFVEHILGKVC